MTSFAGFPDGRLANVRVPDLFFAEVLPHIDHLAELKVTLHLLWLLQQHPERPLGISEAELRRDGVLLAGLAACGPDPQVSLGDGLRRGLERGTLLQVHGTSGGSEQSWYVLNTERGRLVLERVRSGQLALPEVDLTAEEQPLPQKPTVFALYEQNIGPLQPIIAEELEEAQRSYPPEWIEDAFRIAARNNARQWRYVNSVLERWRRQGRDQVEPSDQRDPRRYLTGEYEEYRRS